MKKIEKSSAQQLTLRVPKSLHEALKKLAGEEGVPLNQFCLYLLAKGLGEKEKTQKSS